MPAIGFGTYQLWGDECRESVKKALEIGYRSIDTAEDYENHAEIARAIQESDINRQDIFLTSKIWRLNLRSRDVVASCEKILSVFKTDYIDLLLIHWPSHEIPLEDTLDGFKRLQTAGKMRDFGVSNFSAELCEQALQLDLIDISINQIRFNPFWNNEDTLQFCKKHDIQVTAYTPIAKGRVLSDQELLALAAQIGRPVSQLVLRWLYEKGLVVIPRSRKEENIRTNFDVFSFSLPRDIYQAMEDFLHDHGATGV